MLCVSVKRRPVIFKTNMFIVWKYCGVILVMMLSLIRMLILLLLISSLLPFRLWAPFKIRYGLRQVAITICPTNIPSSAGWCQVLTKSPPVQEMTSCWMSPKTCPGFIWVHDWTLPLNNYVVFIQMIINFTDIDHLLRHAQNTWAGEIVSVHLGAKCIFTKMDYELITLYCYGSMEYYNIE